MKKIWVKLKKIIISKQRGVVSAALVMTSILIVTKLLGFIKIRILASRFGVSIELDTFYAANTIPDALFQAITAGTFSSSIIPLLSKNQEKGKKEFALALNRLLVFFAISFGVIALLLVLFAPQISNLYLIYFKNGTEVLYDAQLLTKMTRHLAFVPLILSISSLVSASLQVKKMFIVSSLSYPLYTIGIIIGSMFFSKYTNPEIMGLVYGTLLGALLHLLVQLPGLFSIPHRLRLVKKVLNRDIKYVFNQSLPRMLGLFTEYLSRLSATQICIGLAQSLPGAQGSLSAFQYALQLYLLPATVLGQSVASAAFPQFTELVNVGKFDEFKNVLRKSMDLVILGTVPVAACVLILRFNLVRVFLSTGATDWRAVLMISWVFAMLSGAIILQSLLMIVLRAYYSLDDTLNPFFASIIGTVSSLVLNIVLTNFFSHFVSKEDFFMFLRNDLQRGVFYTLNDLLGLFFFKGNTMSAIGGIGFAITASLFIQVVFLVYLLNKKHRFIDKAYRLQLYKKIFAGIVATIVLYLTRDSIDSLFNVTKTLDTLVALSIEVFVGCITYLTVLLVIKDTLLWKGLNKVKIRVHFLKGCCIKT